MEIIGLCCWLCRPGISSAERFNCYIVNRASTTWKRTFAWAQPRWSHQPPNRWNKWHLPCVFFPYTCVCGRRRCSRSQPPSSASLFGEDFVRAGRRSMNASAEVFPSPPALAKQEQLLLGKKKKSSWSFKRHGITLSAKSCPVRHWDFPEKSNLCCSSFVLYYEELWLWRDLLVFWETSSTWPVCEKLLWHCTVLL